MVPEPPGRIGRQHTRAIQVICGYSCKNYAQGKAFLMPSLLKAKQSNATQRASAARRKRISDQVPFPGISIDDAVQRQKGHDPISLADYTD